MTTESQETVEPEETVDDALADIDSVRPDKKLRDVVSEDTCFIGNLRSHLNSKT